MADRIAVAGGTGVVGRHVVQARISAGCEPVVLARSTGVDLVPGDGLDGTPDGVRAVVDVSNVVTQRREASVAFFGGAPQVHELTDLVRRLLRARRSRRLVLPLRGPTAASRAVTGGALLPTGSGPRGRQTFDEWLQGSVRR